MSAAVPESTLTSEQLLKLGNFRREDADALDRALAYDSLNNVFNVLDYGATGDGVTDDTVAIQAALDAAGVAHGVAQVPTGVFMFSNLRLSPKSKLRGMHMWQSCLKRIAGSTGIAIREKTIGEGNAEGATGIWIEDIFIDGSGTAGNGIDIGNQDPSNALSTMAGMSRVAVWYFTSGIGMNIRSNASSFNYLWANVNATGIKVAGGGANIFHSTFAEFNTTNQIYVNESGDQFFGIQIQEYGSGANASIVVDGYDNLLSGVAVFLGLNKNEIINNAAGANRNTYRDVVLNPNGFTWTHLIYNATYGTGTGSTVYHVQAYELGDSAGIGSYHVNQATGATSSVIAGSHVFGGTVSVAGNTTLGDASTDAHVINGGATFVDSNGATIAGANLTGITVRDDTPLAAGVGGFISLGGKYTAGGAYADGAVIKAMKTNGTDGNYSYGLVFGTIANGDGAVTERVRISDAGAVTFNSGPTLRTGTGDPEGVVEAPVGSLFLRTDGGASTTLYVKESGVSNTGWAAK